jgi:hypothetical protein
LILYSMKRLIVDDISYASFDYNMWFSSLKIIRFIFSMFATNILKFFWTRRILIMMCTNL